MPHRELLLALLLCTTVAAAQQRPGECPQARTTASAPAEFLAMKNPVPAGPEASKAGQAIFQGDADTDACALCHGKKGDGRGSLAKLYDPPPRNFACTSTMAAITDGQMFWAIRIGIAGTGMPPHQDLKDKQVWQLVRYLREFAR